MNWTAVIGMLVVAWIAQAALSIRQVRQYQAAVRQMSRRSSGYLGVGVFRKFLRRGAVVVLVADSDGRIVEGAIMAGLTVLASLKPYSRYNGLLLSEAMETARKEGADRIALATAGALEQIEQQRTRSRSAETDSLA